jgi:hypothetical protein
MDLISRNSAISKRQNVSIYNMLCTTNAKAVDRQKLLDLIELLYTIA